MGLLLTLRLHLLLEGHADCRLYSEAALCVVTICNNAVHLIDLRLSLTKFCQIEIAIQDGWLR